MTDEDYKNDILNTINKDGYFVFSPSKWVRYETALRAMIRENVVESLGSKVFINGSYIYVKTGNPDGVGVVRVSETQSILKKGVVDVRTKVYNKVG